MWIYDGQSVKDVFWVVILCIRCLLDTKPDKKELFENFLKTFENLKNL